MPRRKRMRIVSQMPKHFGFHAILPEGKNQQERSPVILHLEEFEAIKLMDYEMHSQLEAAGHMNVSRPTITRIYESARQKVAKALVEGLSIQITGGNYELNNKWLICKDCGSTFSDLSPDTKCPWCMSTNIKAQNEEV